MDGLAAGMGGAAHSAVGMGHAVGMSNCVVGVGVGMPMGMAGMNAQARSGVSKNTSRELRSGLATVMEGHDGKQDRMKLGGNLRTGGHRPAVSTIHFISLTRSIISYTINLIRKLITLKLVCWLIIERRSSNVNAVVK